ncbi:metal ABC transporter permease [Effusibacillus lacus]|uniref:Iron ABC transporter n=1 Tax=Effusibacillus lacus TaxID=1348429 RepID=A0A292YNK4_9BACL|nr:metal ABC transporter permease [Effusibacillus lacus]TCS71444.1 manganese/zinc/iron transport system permease protein [Effusibacillus lacus]GAX89974.1 iron ABC transporter [Effusibacillus lacus]
MSDTAWILLTGSLVAASCGFLGCFLILRRLAMLGDAISHAVLPGIVLAFLIAHSMDGVVMLIGAALLGLLTTFFVQTLNQGGVQSDAAIGVTFTALFAIGVVLVSVFAQDVHLDLEHVLYGEIAYVPWNTLTVGGMDLGPRAVWMAGGTFLLSLMVVGLFYKEFKICSFDPAMASAIGIPVVLIHYVMMVLVSMTTVASFESVGAILVVAMLVAPGATAYLLTDRLGLMLGFSVVIGVLCAFLGYYLAVLLDASIAGSMSTVAGVLFTLAFVLSPTHGLMSRWLARRQLGGS